MFADELLLFYFFETEQQGQEGTLARNHIDSCTIRKQRRPRNRWKDEIEKDLSSMEIRGWKEIAKERKKWKQIVKQAKAHTEL